MKKKLSLALLLGVLGLSSSITVFGSPRTMTDGAVFDPEYYAQNNPDVAGVLGDDPDLLYQHYINFGKAEGRKPYSDNTVSTVDTAAPQVESRTNCLTTDLPVFSTEVTARNNTLVPVVLDSSDGHYLCHTNVVTRTDFGTDGSRKDYSNDPIYLAARDYIVEWLISNGDNQNNRTIPIPITFISHSNEDVAYFINLIHNLEIDLHKSEVCKNKTLYMEVNPEDGKGHFDPFGYEEIFFCSIYYGQSPEEMFQKNVKEEIPINPTTGLPAKVGDSWIMENGSMYVVY